MERISTIVLAICVTICSLQPLERVTLILKPAPAEVLFRVNKPFALECSPAEKVAGARYTWKKNGIPLELTPDIVQRSDEGTITFQNPLENDEGVYQCLAETERGTASTRKISVRRAYINTPSVSLKTHKPVLGKEFQLECVIPDAYPKPEITWMYQFVTDSGISHTLLDRRVHNSPDGTLWFSNITRDDANQDFKYVCVGKTPASDDGVVLAEHVIEDVLDNGPQEGQLIPQYVSQDMIAKVGDVTMIYCIYGGTPLGHPDWFKDGKNVNNSPRDRVTRYNRSSGRRLLIRETWLEDQGTYTCDVDNGAGEPQHHEMHLTVVSAPQFVALPPSKAKTNLGQDISITCIVAGVPVPKISWTYNAKSLLTNEKISISNSNNGNNTISELTIKNVQEKDFGYYGCNGVNENGDVYSETLLTY